MTPRGRLYAGTSGFSYPSWRPGFYPAGSHQRDFLRLYGERLPALELHAPFFRLPSEEQVARWAAEVPAGFRFAPKLNRRITHSGAVGLAAEYCERIRLLGPLLGPVLVQLPPERPRDDGVIELLLGSLDPELRYAFDLRDASWDGVEGRLDEAGAVRVGSLEGTAPFRYLRLREPPYDEAALVAVAATLEPLLGAGTDVYAFVKHEDEPLAPRYATRLLELAAAAD